MRKTQQVPAQPIPVGMPYYPGAIQSPSYQPRTAVNNQSQYTMMRTLQTSTDEILEQQNNIYKQLKSNALDKMAKQEYQPAVFAKAVVYRNERSYMRKIDNYFVIKILFSKSWICFAIRTNTVILGWGLTSTLSSFGGWCGCSWC